MEGEWDGEGRVEEDEKERKKMKYNCEWRSIGVVTGCQVRLGSKQRLMTGREVALVAWARGTRVLSST